jgi:hypothetical protein
MTGGKNMGSFTDFLEDKVLNHVFGKEAYGAPQIFVALSATEPTDAGGNVTEPEGNNYSRIPTGAVDWNVSAGGAISNAGDLRFATPWGLWGTMTHFVLYDAAVGGNALVWGALAAEKTITLNDIVLIPAGTLVVSLD